MNSWPPWVTPLYGEKFFLLSGLRYIIETSNHPLYLQFCTYLIHLLSLITTILFGGINTPSILFSTEQLWVAEITLYWDTKFIWFWCNLNSFRYLTGFYLATCSKIALNCIILQYSSCITLLLYRDILYWILFKSPCKILFYCCCKTYKDSWLPL